MVHFANGSLQEAIERVSRSGDRPLRAVFLARALNALARLTPELSDEELGNVAGAVSDYGVLLQALETAEATAVLQHERPLAAARMRGLEARQRLLQAEGGTLAVREVAERLGLTRQAVDKRRRAGRLLALDIGRRGYAYPVWQFGPQGVLPGLEAVLADLPVRDGWMQAAFFLGTDARLGGATPLDQLRHGNADGVRRAARGYGEHSAA